MTTPVRILVTTSRGNKAAEYLDALREAGAEPILADAAGEPPSLAHADGLMLAGGVDVDPASYGASPSPLIGRTEPERDELEIALLRDARERKLPTFCICRGLQLANAAFGGTLIADISAALGNGVDVRHDVIDATGRSERGVIAEHIVRIEPGSLLAQTLRTRSIATGARHHQAVDRCADDLRITGRTDDGIAEALEARFESPFWLAVQWHPESTRALDNGASRQLFTAFTAAASAFASSASI